MCNCPDCPTDPPTPPEDLCTVCKRHLSWHPDKIACRAPAPPPAPREYPTPESLAAGWEKANRIAAEFIAEEEAAAAAPAADAGETETREHADIAVCYCTEESICAYHVVCAELDALRSRLAVTEERIRTFYAAHEVVSAGPDRSISAKGGMSRDYWAAFDALTSEYTP
jgi:hypothetical protein